LCTTNEGHLKGAVRKVLTDPNCLDSLREGRLRFVTDFLDGSKGGSSQKAASTISSIIGYREAGLSSWKAI
jgi:hypothetical protein